LSFADQRRYDDTLHCNRCGLCTSFCPTYLATGNEALSPRGRNQALRASFEGLLGSPTDAARLFDSCLQCGACTTVCFAEVPTAKLMGTARRKVGEVRGVSPIQSFVLRWLLPRPRVMAWVLLPLFWLKRLGVSALLRRTGALARISPALAAADELADRLPVAFAPRRPAPKDAEVVRFVSCGTHFLMPEAEGATERLLTRCGVRHGCAATVCCGLPAVSLGDWDAARALAKKNIEALEKFPAATVLSDDSSCAATLKDYPFLLEGDPLWGPRAKAVAARVRDLSEWAAARDIPAGPVGGVRPSVTYHDPCKARHAQKLTEAPRALLTRLPGMDFRELPEADQCCGGGGTTSFLEPEISRAVLDRKAHNVLSTGAAVVVSSAGSCLIQLRFGLRRARSVVKALHLAELLEKW
jgi:glycolate oxidase iron-sulfur subunit